MIQLDVVAGVARSFCLHSFVIGFLGRLWQYMVHEECRLFSFTKSRSETDIVKKEPSSLY